MGMPPTAPPKLSQVQLPPRQPHFHPEWANYSFFGDKRWLSEIYGGDTVSKNSRKEQPSRDRGNRNMDSPIHAIGVYIKTAVKRYISAKVPEMARDIRSSTEIFRRQSRLANKIQGHHASTAPAAIVDVTTAATTCTQYTKQNPKLGKRKKPKNKKKKKTKKQKDTNRGRKETAVGKNEQRLRKIRKRVGGRRGGSDLLQEGSFYLRTAHKSTAAAAATTTATTTAPTDQMERAKVGETTIRMRERNGERDLWVKTVVVT